MDRRTTSSTRQQLILDRFLLPVLAVRPDKVGQDRAVPLLHIYCAAHARSLIRIFFAGCAFARHASPRRRLQSSGQARVLLVGRALLVTAHNLSYSHDGDPDVTGARSTSSDSTSGKLSDQWVIAPGHHVTNHWITRLASRLILVLVPHPQALDRLLDILPLVEADHRVQVVFTTPASQFQWTGMKQLVDDAGGLWVPWSQALTLDVALVLAACHWGVRELPWPVLLTAHGSGMVRSRIHPWGAEQPHDLHAGNLMRNGEVVPAALALAHEGELAELRQSCPQALSRAVVAGDLCFDRMVASLPYRSRYCDALGVHDERRLVVVNTTWSPYSLFGTDPECFARFAAELPADRYRVVGVVHPFVWLAHGRRQVLAWLAEARTAGVDFLPMTEAWRAAVVSADLVVTDHGSVGHYAAGLGVPMLMCRESLIDVRPGSTAAALARLTTPLHLDRPLRVQVEQAIAQNAGRRDASFTGLITSRPGQAGVILRQTIYRLLGLPEPSHSVPVMPVREPTLMP
jgi:hypothetical protein